MTAYLKVYIILLCVVLIFYILPIRKKAQHERMITLLMLLWLLTTLAGRYMVNTLGFKNNLLVFHICTPIEYAILCVMYKQLIVSPFLKRLIMLSIPSFILLAAFFSAFVQQTDVNNSIIFIIESVLMVIWSLLYLREVMLLQQITSLHRFPAFWISVAILFYYIGHLVIEGMLNYLMSISMDLAVRIYRVEYLFKYLALVLFAIGSFYSKTAGVLQKDKRI